MVICVTNKKLCKDDFLKRLDAICKAKPKFVLLREKELNEFDYQALAEQCLAICKAYDVQLVLHTYHTVARALGLTTIHLPLHCLEQQQHALKGFTGIGTSIHSVKEAKLAQKLGATYLIAGHIFQTDCKADLAPRGISFLKNVLTASKVPVYPIGGIHLDHVQDLVNAGAKDFCVMAELMVCDHVEQQIKAYHTIKPKTDLCTIPGVGANMKNHMEALGYRWVEDLKEADPQDMYQRDCLLHHGKLDRCVLYVYRLAVYVANTPNPNPQKLKWWLWKDNL